MKSLIASLILLLSLGAHAKTKMECSTLMGDHIQRLKKITRSYDQKQMEPAAYDYLIKLNDQTAANLIQECRTRKHLFYSDLQLSWDDYSKDFLNEDSFALELYDQYAKVRDELMHGTERVD